MRQVGAEWLAALTPDTPEVRKELGAVVAGDPDESVRKAAANALKRIDDVAAKSRAAGK